MREDGQEKIGDAEIPAAQRRLEGVAEIRAFDPSRGSACCRTAHRIQRFS